MTPFPNASVIDHPLVQHKLTLLRRKEVSTAEFRLLIREISLLMLYEVTRDLPLELMTIENAARTDAGADPLRQEALPRLDPACRQRPARRHARSRSVRTGSAISGSIRDPETLVPIEYYLKLPDDVANRMVIIVDPMLATGYSAAAAVTRLKEAGATHIKFVCIITVPEGLQVMQDIHPDVTIYTCVIDRQLDDHGYIRPGLGDAGDRIYGTK